MESVWDSWSPPKDRALCESERDYLRRISPKFDFKALREKGFETVVKFLDSFPHPKILIRKTIS